MGFHRDLRGLALHAPSNEKVENNSGSSIPKLKVVSLDGHGALYPQIILANPLVRFNFGITNAEIADGDNNTVSTIGFMLNVDSSSWAPNTILYSTITGDLTTTVLGNPVAIVIKQDVSCGVLYVITVGDAFGDAQNPWLLAGNSGTDEDANFLGTADTQGVQIKTDNTNRIFIDSSGNTAFGQHKPDGFIHIKEHMALPGTGRIINTFSVATSDTAYNTAFSYLVPDGAVAKIKIHAVGRESSTSRCSFERTNTYIRDGGSAIKVDAIGQSSYTYRSDSGYNFRWSQSGNMALLEVKSNTANDTKWVGTVEIDLLIDS